ncbi:uncharacterized protein LOC134276215 [Saccostrea cucullata]|uniref:uncharacterized protein LOC134276215 n=1 Tax=Saccostrea cuccullata TaxID=36930 RepID=UPI002ED44A17
MSQDAAQLDTESKIYAMNARQVFTQITVLLLALTHIMVCCAVRCVIAVYPSAVIFTDALHLQMKFLLFILVIQDLIAKTRSLHRRLSYFHQIQVCVHIHHPSIKIINDLRN